MAAEEELPSLTLVQLYQDAIFCSRVCHCASTVSSGAVSHRQSHRNFRGHTDGPHSQHYWNHLAFTLFKCILSYRTKIADKSKTNLVHEKKEEGLINLFESHVKYK